MPEPIDDALAKRKLKTEIQRQQRQEAKKTEEAGVTEPVTWVGHNSADGKGVVRTQSGEIRTGIEVVTQGQIQPGTPILGLEGASGFVTGNQMPAPTRHRQPERRRPQLTPKTNTAYLVETVYESEKTVKSSCETKLAVSAVFSRDIIEYADIGALTYTIHKYPGSHPDELCPCDRRWAPSSEGCILACDSNGEFATQSECENYRNNPPPLPGTTRISAKITWQEINPSGDNHYYAGFPDGWIAGFYGNSPYRNAFIVKRKSQGLEPVDFNPYLQKWKLSYFASWPGEPELFLDLNECDIYSAGLFMQWEIGGISIEPTQPQNGSAVSGQFALTPWPGSLPPTGRIFTESFISDNGQTKPHFEGRGVVDSWGTRQNPGPTPYFQPPYYINNNVDAPNNSHYRVKFYLSCFTKSSLFLGEYLMRGGDYNFYDPAQGGYPDNYLQFGDEAPVDALMCCVGPRQFEVVVKYGKFKERVAINGQEVFNTYWCAIDRYFIDGISIEKTTYKYPAFVPLHPNNWMAALMQNWKYEYFAAAGSYNEGNLIECDKHFRFLFKFTEDYGAVYHSDIPHRAIAEYLNGWACISGHKFTGSDGFVIPIKLASYNAPEDYYRIQGARIGNECYKPEYTANMGCNFVKDSQTNKWYVIDCCLHQWIPGAPPPEADGSLSGNILIEALHHMDALNLQFKVGEAEVVYESYYDEYSNSTYTTETQNNQTYANIKIKDLATVGGKKAFKIDLENAGVLEVQAWVDPVVAKNASVAFTKFPLYKTSIFGQVGESSYDFVGFFTYAHQYPIANQANNGYIVPPRFNLAGNADMSTLSFRDCAGTLLAELNAPPNYVQGGIRTNSTALDVQVSMRPLIIGSC